MSVVEVYRGCTILKHREDLYGSSCTAHLRFTIDRVKEDIDTYLDGTGDEYWAYHSTYRGIEIKVWLPGSTHYNTYTDTYFTSTSLSEVQSKIDEFLGDEEPPADGKKAAALGGLGLIILLYLIFKGGK